MLEPRDFERMEASLCTQAKAKFGIDADRLDVVMKRIGRRASGKHHRAASMIATARHHAGHPKLRFMIDADAVTRAFDVLTAYLDAIDPADRRRGLILSTLAMMSFHLIAVFVILIGVLIWRGFL